MGAQCTLWLWDLRDSPPWNLDSVLELKKRESWWGHYFLPDGLTFPNQGSALEDSCCDHKLREQKAGGLLCVT